MSIKNIVFSDRKIIVKLWERLNSLVFTSIMGSNHPDVMDARVKYAKMAGGERDRTQLDISLGFLQSPKGPTFIGKQVAVFGGGGQKKDGSGEDIMDAEVSSDDGFDQLFPSPNEIQEKLVPIRQRLLEAK